MAGRIDGRVALITGAASGIGEATAKRFAQEGAKVVVADINGEAAERVAAQIRAAAGDAVAFRADVADALDAAAMIAQAIASFGRLDILHNNATSGTMGYIGDTTLEGWNHTLAVNLTAPFLAAKAALPGMIAQGGGVIINTSSAAAISAEHGLGAYAAAKAGVISLTRSIAIEYARHNIRCNCIVPGGVLTPPTQAFINAVDGAHARMLKANPAHRLGRPEELANVALFLASDESSFVNGAAYLVDGASMATHNIGLMGGE